MGRYSRKPSSTCTGKWFTISNVAYTSAYLMHVIEKHLAHFEYGYGGVHRALKPKLANQIRQGSKMGSVGIRQ